MNGIVDVRVDGYRDGQMDKLDEWRIGYFCCGDKISDKAT